MTSLIGGIPTEYNHSSRLRIYAQLIVELLARYPAYVNTRNCATRTAPTLSEITEPEFILAPNPNRLFPIPRGGCKNKTPNDLRVVPCRVG